MKLVVALGGNALERPGQSGRYEEQVQNVRVACAQVYEIIKQGHRVILTHGNGPQIGYLAIAESSTTEVKQQPLHVLGAMSQGEIGYLIQRELGNLFRRDGRRTSVVSVVTQVLVNSGDAAFKNPTKPIGPFYDEATARRLERERGFAVKRVLPNGERPWRRVVPSPDPISIVEQDWIAHLGEASSVVIAAGGGGIPVVRSHSGDLEGVDAVLDKDLAAEKLAEAVGAEGLLLLTNIDGVHLDFGGKDERRVDSLTVSEAQKLLSLGSFPPGTMGPKVMACVRFLEWGGRLAVIGRLEEAVEVLAGSTGTRFVSD